MNNKLITTTMAMLLLVSVFATSYGTLVIAKRPQPGIDFNGPHYNLLIHGVPKEGDKPVPDDQTTGRHSVFIPLDTQDDVTIYLEMDGNEWLVKDPDATGDSIIRITLPRELWIDTDTIPDGILDTKLADIVGYRVFLVGLGKPSEFSETIIYSDADVTLADPVAGGSGTIYWELTNDELSVDGHRKGKKGQGNTGQPQWYNATDLITATVWIWENDINLDANWWDPDPPVLWDGTLEGTDGWGDPLLQEVYEYTDYSIFDVPGLEDYWWKVNNNDVRLMQVRFYPILKYVNGNGNGNGNNH